MSDTNPADNGNNTKGRTMTTYTINSECGVMDIQAESIDDAKEIYAREKHFDFNVAAYPGSWYSIGENGEKVESEEG